MKNTTVFAIALVGLVLIVAMLACAATPDSLRIDGLPQYVCPSATPRPTDTPRPTSSPSYPPAFQAYLDYYHIDVTRSVVNVRYLAQSVGAVQLSYSGTTLSGQLWTGSGGVLPIGSAPYGSPGVNGAYPVVIPSDVSMATITVYGGRTLSFTVVRLPYPFFSNPNPSPCCLPSPIYPTPVPTYTPYPTPTPYVRTNDYFIGDPVYSNGALRVKFRVTEITALPTDILDRTGSPQTIYVWRAEVKNVGSGEYTLFPAAQMYVSEIITPSGGTLTGVWGASLAAAEAAGITPDYDPVTLQPGQADSFALAAFGPAGTAYRLSYAMDATAREGGPTQVPGRNIVSWLNAVNTECRGEIEEPR